MLLYTISCLVLLVGRSSSQDTRTIARPPGNVGSSLIPTPRFRHQLNQLNDISLPPNLLPNAFAKDEITPIFKNKDFPVNSSRKQNAIEKSSKSRQQKTQPNTRTRQQNTRRTEQTTKTETLRVKRIRRPVLRRDNSLEQQRSLPLNFRTLGILPTGFSVDSPVPGSRIRLDRTLNRGVQPRPIQEGEIPLPQNELPNMLPPEQDIISTRGPPRFLDAQPPQQNVGPPSRIQNGVDGDMIRVTDRQEPQWPIPIRQRDGMGSPFPQEQLPFPEFTSFQQPSEQSMPERLIPSSGFSVPFQTVGFGYPILPNPGFLPFPSNNPWIPNAFPYFNYADYLDIDMDNLLFSNAFYPRLTHISQFMRTRLGQVPTVPFRRLRRFPVVRTGITQIPVRQRPLISTTTPSSRFSRITPSPSTTRSVGRFDRVLPITTPPSVQVGSLVPPPSSFFIREGELYPFYQQPFLNPYLFDSFDGTFLSDFHESPGNRTIAIPVWRTGTSNKNKAERIKILRQVNIHKLEDRKGTRTNSLRKSTDPKTKPRRKPWYYRNIKPF